MTHTHPPKVGSWFQLSPSEKFEVVALDEDDGTIEIQYFDGAVEEWDMDTWYEESVVPVDAPEDWTGSYDIEKEDHSVDYESGIRLGHNNPFDELDQ